MSARARPTSGATPRTTPRTGPRTVLRTGPPLPLRAEVGRQLRRRRTQWLGALLVALPLLLVGAFALGGAPSGVGFVSLATAGAVNFATFGLFAASGFLLTVLAALLAGDTVAAEASWSSLRYLLAAPVPRRRLLRVKLTVALASTVLAVLTLIAVCLVLGWAFYGWHPLSLIGGRVMAPWTAVGRLVLGGLDIVVQLLWVSAVAFLIGTLTDAPLGAVGGAVMASILSAILDSITALGNLRVWLPTHDAFAWADLLAPTVTWHDIARGALVSLMWAVLALGAAWRHFTRKDVTS